MKVTYSIRVEGKVSGRTILMGLTLLGEVLRRWFLA